MVQNQIEWTHETVKTITDTYLELAKLSGKADDASEIAIQLYREEIEAIVHKYINDMDEQIIMELDPMISHPLNQTFIRDIFQ